MMLRLSLCALEILAACCALAISPALGRGYSQPRNPGLNRQFQSAVTFYQNGQYEQAAQILSGLLRLSPSDFQVNELAGMVFAAQKNDQEAVKYLTQAVRLKPDSAQAHSALAASLAGLHDNSAAEREFKKAAALDPRSFDTNHNLGEFFIQTGSVAQAVLYLAKAQAIDPSSYNNGYDLALAEIKTGQAAAAENHIKRLLAVRNTAELHSLLASADEKAGHYLAAEQEYQLAAHMDPSEANIFSWGSELLAHHTLEPAAEVFSKGAELYPQSARMEVGLGIALYSRTHYNEAIRAFCRAIDLNPQDSRPYMFLGQIYDVSPLQAAAVTKRFERYAELQPRNPQALYYYALSLWKASRTQNSPVDLVKVGDLLRAAIKLDPSFADAHMQLGTLYSGQHRNSEAIAEFREAIRLRPQLADAHYHLGEALVRAGQRAAAAKEFATFNRLHETETREREKQRSQILQFVKTAGAATETH
ncbi:MAG: tetratricopeptide repeat protein [Acidobacteriota bacterium]|nr:tetratricopeptide repeat protein [Acidobacteriota bacterium]